MEALITKITNAKFTYNNSITSNEIKSQHGEIIQTGIGDILLLFLLINNKLISGPLYFNLSIYIDNLGQFNNTTNNFDFKLQLFNKICANDKIIFYYDKTFFEYTNNWQSKLANITNYNVMHNYFDFVNPFKQEYIIFHTKCRFADRFNYSYLKERMKLFCKNFKTNYQIIILGERYMPRNLETDVHQITTIYDELIELKSNNNVLDLSLDNIYDNLNFENYCKDMSLIHHAKNNILVGHGGQYCNSIIFGKGMIVFTQPILLGQFNEFNTDKIDNCYSYFDMNSFFQKINAEYSVV
jgi:hypothetical protein